MATTRIEGIDYRETLSLVIRYESVRMLLVLVAQFAMAIRQMGVTTAFLYGEWEEIYMRPPVGSNMDRNTVCRLRQLTYGLKQSPLRRNKKVNGVLESFGSHCDASALSDVIPPPGQSFAMKDLGPAKVFLNWRERTTTGLSTPTRRRLALWAI